jgi:hypothetical protein
MRRDQVKQRVDPTKLYNSQRTFVQCAEVLNGQQGNFGSALACGVHVFCMHGGFWSGCHGSFWALCSFCGFVSTC